MNDDKVYLTYILECIANVQELTSSGRADFESAKHDQAAVLYYLQTMAESTQRLSEALKAAHSDMDWLAISGFRNRLAHGYLDVNKDILWSVIEKYLPELQTVAREMLESLDAEEDE